MDYTIQTISSQLKESYKIILLVFIAAFTLQFSSDIPLEFFESAIVIRISTVILPLAVAISSFVISKIYGGSKVFGKSYLLLGLGFVSVFFGEVVYFFLIDPGTISDHNFLGDLFFLISYPLVFAHVIINMRYFAEKFEDYQKVLLVVIPTITILVYSLLVNLNPPEDSFEFYYSLLFVTESAIMLGLIIVAFSVFRHTVLSVPWFLLLVGFLIGVIGDVAYNYAYTIGFFNFGNPSLGLWLASNMMLIYALYKHQKSI